MDLDTESKRCLIDHHMRRLLINPRLTENWNAWYGMVEKELYRTGCVLQRGTKEKALQENIAGIKEFPIQIERFSRSFDSPDKDDHQQGQQDKPVYSPYKQRIEAEWGATQWNKWTNQNYDLKNSASSRSNSNSWRTQTWSSNTPKKTEGRNDGQEVDWEGVTANMMKQFPAAPSTPKTELQAQ